MRTLTHHIELPLPPSAAFALLHTPSAIREWWHAARVIVVERAGGTWAAAWGADEDAPDYVTVARILEWDPPATLRLGSFEYVDRHGGPLPFAASLETEFALQPSAQGAMLVVTQSGFPDDASADTFVAACDRGWRTTLESLRDFVDRDPARHVSTVSTVAMRVHLLDAMIAFYAEAFGARFRFEDTGGIQSAFGELPGITLKLVPIRAAADFTDFPVHQLGLSVDDVERVMALAVQHGGRVQDAPRVVNGRLHGALRDPDGNTIEVYGRSRS